MTEMSDTAILLDLGELLWEAAAAFGKDPRYFTDMAESANLITYKRQLWEARAEAMETAKTPDAVRELTLEILKARGVTPTKRRR